MLQLQRKQKTKDGQQGKHQEHFGCTITCEYCGNEGHYEDDGHINCRESAKLSKAEEERRKNTCNPRGEATMLGDPPVGVTMVEDEGSQPSPLVDWERPTPHLRVSSRVKSGLSPPPQALAAPRRTRTPRSAGSDATLSACRRLGWT